MVAQTERMGNIARLERSRGAAAGGTGEGNPAGIVVWPRRFLGISKALAPSRLGGAWPQICPFQLFLGGLEVSGRVFRWIEAGRPVAALYEPPKLFLNGLGGGVIASQFAAGAPLYALPAAASRARASNTPRAAPVRPP